MQLRKDFVTDLLMAGAVTGFDENVQSGYNEYMERLDQLKEKFCKNNSKRKISFKIF